MCVYAFIRELETKKKIIPTFWLIPKDKLAIYITSVESDKPAEKKDQSLSFLLMRTIGSVRFGSFLHICFFCELCLLPIFNMRDLPTLIQSFVFISVFSIRSFSRFTSICYEFAMYVLILLKSWIFGNFFFFLNAKWKQQIFSHTNNPEIFESLFFVFPVWITINKTLMWTNWQEGGKRERAIKMDRLKFC